MGVVNSKNQFLYAHVGAEGSASDSGVFRKSRFGRQLMNRPELLNLPDDEQLPGQSGKQPFFFVADDAFKLSKHLLKPFSRLGLEPRERVFNYRLSRGRMVIKMTFGLMVTRFRLFRQAISFSPQNTENIIMASVFLHNFLQEHVSTVEIPAADLMPAADPGVLLDLEPTQARNPTEDAKEARENLAQYFSSREGQIPKQWLKAFP